jgi:hypothetical protein
MEHILPVGDSEGVRKALAAYMDHHIGVAAADGHRKGLHRADVEVDSHQCGDGEENDAHSLHVHSNPGGSGWGTVPGNEHGGCILEVQEISDRIPLSVESSGEGTETGKDHGKGAPQKAGSSYIKMRTSPSCLSVI